MMVILTGPLCLLCSYLAWLCFRRGFRNHALALGGFALFFAVLTIVVVGASYYTWQAFEVKTATSLLFL